MLGKILESSSYTGTELIVQLARIEVQAFAERFNYIGEVLILAFLSTNA